MRHIMAILTQIHKGQAILKEKEQERPYVRHMVKSIIWILSYQDYAGFMDQQCH